MKSGDKVLLVLAGFAFGFGAAGMSTVIGKQPFMEMIFVGFFSALLSFFLQFCYAPGNIFEKWIPFIERNLRDNPKTKFGFLAQPLGLCVYCQNIWIAAVWFAVMNIVTGLTWWMFIPALAFAHYTLNCLDRLFWQNT